MNKLNRHCKHLINFKFNLFTIKIANNKITHKTKLHHSHTKLIDNIIMNFSLNQETIIDFNRNYQLLRAKTHN